MNTAPIRPAEGDEHDELARAEVYGLLAQLFIAPPAEPLHEALKLAPTQAPVPGAFLEHSWTDLVGAARQHARDEIDAEYQALFGGVGRPELFLHGSYHLAGALNETPLVALRDELRRLGLERPPQVLDTEDHVALLCEVMRFLIAGDDLSVSHLANQRRFFDAQLRPWAGAMCESIEAHPRAAFYRALARFARAFFEVEGQAFDMLDT